jgi:serine/threonine protein kinase/tetratricopeptide (TPR) repeat protein/TolB-like protein
MDDGIHKPQPEPFRDGARSSLTPERWQQIKEVFGLALECEPDARGSVLQEACGGDESLRAEVQSLLVAAEANGTATSEVFHSVLSPSSPQPPSSDTEDPMLDRRVGAYCLERRIGYGGMASVYLAARADDQYRKQVAIKLLRPELDNTELLKRFRNERQTLAGLDHPNIVKLLDGGSTPEGLPFLVMDYVEGKPIDEYSDQHKLSIDARLHLFGKVCDAVQYAHQHLVIHRDLKPSNILVTADGTPKLLDFGIAKVLDPVAPVQALTQTITRRMTPAYASPEQVRGESVTIASDIYSLGVVLYQLLTGHRPYKLGQSTPLEMERAICEEEPESPSTAVNRVETVTEADGTRRTTVTPELVSQTREGQPDKLRRRLRGDLDNIVLKALQKEPQRRYPSVAELSQDITRHVENLPVTARPSTVAYRVSKLVRRHRTEAFILGMLVVVLLGAVAFSTWQERRALEKARAELGGDRLPGRPSVAVLGFKNLSSRPETSWVSTALAEMLTAELAAGGNLRTIPEEDVAHLRVDLSLPETNSLAPQTLSRVRRYLKSDYVIAGSYLDLGDAGSRQVRLDLLLQNAAVGDTLASVTLNGAEADLPDLVVRAGASLRDKLGAGAIPPTESAKVKASQPSNLEALRLYSQGVEKLRSSDPVSGRSLLERAAASDPNSALIHSALAEAWGVQGFDAKAREEANKALALAAGLPREQSLSIEGEALRVTQQWPKDAEIYRTLFTFFPDNLDYGVLLVASLASAGKGADAMAAVEELHKSPKPMGDHPRVDLAEAEAADALQDFNREAAAAARCAAKAKDQGMLGLEAEAYFVQSRAFGRMGQSEKGLAAAEHAKQLWASVSDRYGVARALNSIGSANDDLGRILDAEQAYEESLRVFRDLGNRRNEGTVLNNMGIIRWRKGDFQEARNYFQESVDISREFSDLVGVARALSSLATIDMADHNYVEAKAHYREALAIDQRRGDQASVAGVLINLSNISLAEEDLPAAKTALQDSIRISRKIGQKNQLAEALANLGDILFLQGEVAPARHRYSDAIRIFTETGNQIDQMIGLQAFARYSLAAGDLPGARKQAEAALTISDKMGDKAWLAVARERLAEISLEEGNAEDAERLARQAVVEFRNEKSAGNEAEADLVLARVLREQGKPDEAESSMASARELMSKSKDRGARISLFLESARVQAALGEDTEAMHMLSDALAEAKKAGLVPLEFEARLALGKVEMKSRHSAGRTRLASLEQDARGKGFLLIAREAAAARKQKTTSHQVADGR